MFPFKSSRNYTDTDGFFGIGVRTKENWGPSDIDIHVPGDPRGWEAPDHLRIYDWDKIMKVMKDLVYVLIDIHEHEFQKDGLSVEFGSIDSLPDFAGVFGIGYRADSSR